MKRSTWALLAVLALSGCPDDGGGAAAPSANTAPAVMLVASKNGEVYHLPTCKKALEIAAENRVEYETAGKARHAGKRRCKECGPP